MISALRQRSSKIIPKDALAQLARVAGVSIRWLAGEGDREPMRTSSTRPPPEKLPSRLRLVGKPKPSMRRFAHHPDMTTAQERIEALEKEVARLRVALAYLEGRAKDYPVLFVLLAEARKQ